ncbi:MAG: tetratricopeptide repeat protein, partial [Candidatus Firestonebacteria bacterium]|nr:tetratricopeptide repeat protein [Candidatus Firestonebacteria bacterium]
MENKEIIFRTGYDNFLSKRYDAAIEQFSKYINKFPKDKNIISVYYLFGESYYGKGEYEKAINIFHTILNNYQPTEILIRKTNFSLAYAYISNNQIEKAMDEFAHIVSNYPFTTEGLLSQLKLGDCFYDKQEFEKASEVYNKVYNKVIENKAITSSLPDIGNRLAASLFRLGEFNKSIKIYEEIISKFPEHEKISSIKINLAIINLYIRNFNKSREILFEITNPRFAGPKT